MFILASHRCHFLQPQFKGFTVSLRLLVPSPKVYFSSSTISTYLYGKEEEETAIAQLLTVEVGKRRIQLKCGSWRLATISFYNYEEGKSSWFGLALLFLDTGRCVLARRWTLFFQFYSFRRRCLELIVGTCEIRRSSCYVDNGAVREVYGLDFTLVLIMIAFSTKLYICRYPYVRILVR